MPISTITANSVANNSLTTDQFASTAVHGRRNLIINGAMQVAQRGTSAASVTASGYHTVDRLNNLISGAGTWTFSQDSDVPSGQGFSYSNKRQCTTANASLGTGAYMVDYYGIEGQDLQHLAFATSSAKSLTLSFWIKTNKTGTYQITFTTAPSTRSIGASYTVNAADTWEKKTLTIVGDTSNAIVNNNTSGLTIEMWYAAGTAFTSGAMPTAWEARVSADRAAALTVNLADSTSNYLNITGLQLEIGDVATPFEQRSYGDELARCLRYYEKKGQPSTATAWSFYEMNAVIAQATDYVQGDKFKVEKRTDPTLVFYSRNGTSGKISSFNSGGDVTGSWAQNAKGATGFHAVVGPASSVTKGDGYEYGYTADAEL